MRRPSTCQPAAAADGGDATLRPGRVLLLTGARIGTFSNHLRSVVNGLSLALVANASLALDPTMSMFVASFFQLGWLRRSVSARRLVLEPTVGRALALRGRADPGAGGPAAPWAGGAPAAAAAVRLSPEDAFWCGGPCDGAQLEAESGAALRAWGVTARELLALRAGGQSGTDPDDDLPGRPGRMACAHWPFRPRAEFIAAAARQAAAEPRWGGRVLGHHQRAQTVTREGLGANCRKAARRLIELHAGGAARPPGPALGPLHARAAALAYYESVCDARALPSTLLAHDAARAREGAGARRVPAGPRAAHIFLATDRFVRTAFAAWINHPRVFMRRAAPHRARARAKSDMLMSYKADLGRWLSTVARRAEGGAPLDAAELAQWQQGAVQAAASEMDDMLLLVAADEFWPTPGSTFSEAVCYWRTTWGGARPLPPLHGACRDIVRGWGPLCPKVHDMKVRRLDCRR